MDDLTGRLEDLGDALVAALPSRLSGSGAVDLFLPLPPHPSVQERVLRGGRARALVQKGRTERADASAQLPLDRTPRSCRWALEDGLATRRT